MSSASVLTTRALTKRYGSARGITALDLDVKRGEVFGFLGPNGAGKTTTLRLLLDLIRPTSGCAEVLGLDCRRDSIAVRRAVGYLPGEYALYGNLTGGQLIRYLGSLRGGVDTAFVGELAERLDADLGRKLRELSHGNRQKIGLIQAMMSRPELLILDEPTTGLDPLVQRELYALLAETRDDGRTVFFSSHVLPEVERCCDRVAIVRKGELIRVAEVQSIRTSAIRSVELRFAGPVDRSVLERIEGVRGVTQDAETIRLTIVGPMGALVKQAAELGVIDFVSHQPSLEEAFLALYGDGVESGGAADAQ